MRLANKVAIVTGGSQGIGEAIAKRYASEGAKVAILNRNSEKAIRVVEEIEAAGGAPQASLAILRRSRPLTRRSQPPAPILAISIFW